MITSLEDTKLRTGTIAKFCGCTVQTIANHCKNGELCSRPRSSDRGYYSISGIAFAEYLITHPSAFQYYKNMELHGEDEDFRNAILEKIGLMPKAYTIYDFMDIFGVTDRTINQWVKRGYMKSYNYEHRHSHYKVYFTDDSLKELITNCKKARKFYMEYIEKRKAS